MRSFRIFHFIDGCYELGAGNEPIDFYTADAPSLKELDQVLAQIIKRLTKYLERQKIIAKDNENFQLEIPDEDTFSKLQASSVTYRFATDPNKGKKALVLKTVPQILSMGWPPTCRRQAWNKKNLKLFESICS